MAENSVESADRAFKSKLYTSPGFAVCTVDDCFAHTGTYLVTLPAGTTVPACELLHVAGIPMGARPIGMYPPNTRVVVMFHSSWECAVILGAMPGSVTDQKLVLPDSLVLRSNVGFFQDPYHYSPFTKSILSSYAAGRPSDAIPGDWGTINDLGLAVLIGRTMAMLRASDAAKVEAFWGDDLLRLTAYNYELFTAGLHEFRINDENEYNEVERLSPFPWEGLGSATSDGATTKAATGQLKPNAEAAPLEPASDNQLILARLLRFRGYLGGVEREVVCLPPKALKVESYSQQTKYTGVLEIEKNLSGAYSVRSAKEITLEKYLFIPVPKELVAAEDPTGDAGPAYKAAGLGDANVKLPEFIFGDLKNPEIEMTQLFDYHAYFFGTYTNAQFDAHTKDWYLPNESDITDLAGSAVYPGAQLQIKHTFSAPMPTFGTLTIDHRQGHSCKYYRTRSCFKLLDDGGILIEDGYGSQIRMTGGNIFLSAVGDIWQLPGRSAVTWAPYDAIIRAGNSADITAAQGDLRLKAEQNLQILAGNSGDTGGLVLECRSKGDISAADFAQTGEQVQGHGIVIKSTDSPVQVFGRDIHIGRNQTDEGQVTIDAGDQGRLFLRGQNILGRTTQRLIIEIANEQDSSTIEALAMDQNSAVISTDLEIGGQTIITSHKDDGALVVSGQLICHDEAVFEGVVVSNGGFASINGPTVAPLKDKVDITPKIDELKKIIEDQLKDIGQAIQPLEDAIASDADTSPGNDSYQKALGVSMRDTVKDFQLNAASFIIYESRWQQMLRIAGNVTTWDEPIVKAPNGDDTRPHPGQDGWENFQSFGTTDVANFDFTKGQSKKRSAVVGAAKAPKKKDLKSTYNVNVQQ